MTDEEAKARMAAQLSKDREYIDRIIELDYGTTLDDLTALVLVAAGALPPAKPYNVMGLWKMHAQRVLMEYVFGKPGFKYARHYVGTVVLYLCRRQGIIIGSASTRLPGWEHSYARQIAAARRNADGHGKPKVQHGRR